MEALCEQFRAFNKHRRPMKHVGYFAQRSRLLFSRKNWEATSLNNVINKKGFIKPEWTGFTLCFSHVNAIFQSIFQKINRFTQNFFTCKVRNLVFIIRSLVVGE